MNPQSNFNKQKKGFYLRSLIISNISSFSRWPILKYTPLI